MARLLAAALVALCLGCASVPAKEYREIDGLLLSSAVQAVPAGSVETTLWGETVAANAYKLTAPVSVQVECNIVSAKFAQAVVHYELRVVPDPDLRFRKRFLREIYDYWKTQDESYLQSYEHLPAEKSVVEKNGRYLLYVRSDHEREGATYRFHANGRLFELELERLESPGWGPLSSLIAEHVAFLENGETIADVYFEPKFPPKNLLALIESDRLR